MHNTVSQLAFSSTECKPAINDVQVFHWMEVTEIHQYQSGAFWMSNVKTERHLVESREVSTGMCFASPTEY